MKHLLTIILAAVFISTAFSQSNNVYLNIDNGISSATQQQQSIANITPRYSFSAAIGYGRAIKGPLRFSVGIGFEYRSFRSNVAIQSIFINSRLENYNLMLPLKLGFRTNTKLFVESYFVAALKIPLYSYSFDESTGGGIYSYTESNLMPSLNNPNISLGLSFGLGYQLSERISLCLSIAYLHDLLKHEKMLDFTYYNIMSSLKIGFHF